MGTENRGQRWGRDSKEVGLGDPWVGAAGRPGWGNRREGGAELGPDPRKEQCLGPDPGKVQCLQPGKLGHRPVRVEVPSLGHKRTGRPGLQLS